MTDFELESDRLRAHLNRAHAYAAMDQPEEALEALNRLKDDKALASRPDVLADALVLSAGERVLVGDVMQSVEILQGLPAIAAEFDRDDVDLIITRGTISVCQRLADAGHSAQTISASDSTVEWLAASRRGWAPSYLTDLRILRGTILQSNSQVDAALAEYSAIVAIARDNPELSHMAGQALTFTAVIREEQGRLGDAVELYGEVLTVCAQPTPENRYWVARAMFATGSLIADYDTDLANGLFADMRAAFARTDDERIRRLLALIDGSHPDEGDS